MLTKKQLLFLLIAVGFLLRFVNIADPVLELHSTRQILTSMVAKNFFENGIDLLKPVVDTAAFGKYYLVEVHFYPAVLSVLYRLLGGPADWVGRLVSILFGIATIYVTFLLVKKYFDENTALYAAAFMALSPIAVLFSKTVQPESSMLFFSVLSVLLFSEWIDKNDLKTGVIALLSLIITFLLKPPTACLLLPLAVIAYQKKKINLMTAGFFALALLPLVLWFYYVTSLPAGWVVSGLGFENYSTWGASALLSTDFYLKMGFSIIFLVLTPLGALAFLAGLLEPKKKEFVFYAWLLAILAYFVILAGANMNHNYYQLPLAPVAAVFVAKAVRKLEEKNLKKISRKWVAAGIGVFLLSSFFFIGLNSYMPPSVQNIPQVGKQIQQLVPKDAKVIALFSSGPALLYYIDRNGDSFWVHDPAENAIDKLERMRSEGYEYFASVYTYGKLGKMEVNDVRTNEEFYSYLKNKYHVLTETSDFIAVDLRTKR